MTYQSSLVSVSVKSELIYIMHSRSKPLMRWTH